MPAPVIEVGSPKRLSATGLVYTGPVHLLGMFVSTASAATVIVYDGTSASGTVLVNAWALVAGWNSMPFVCQGGIFVALTGTADFTVSFAPQ